MPTNNPSQIDVSRMSRAVVPVLEACSPASEDARRVEPEAMAAIQAAGLSRLLTPERFGGSEAPVSTHVPSCTELARGCAAASWVHMVCGAHTFVVGRYPEACQEEVFGPTPDVLIPGALAPQGRAERVAEGWELNGRWQFGSGVDHGPWVVLGAQTIDVEEHGVPAIHLVIPRADITIDDTWHTLGMRGTGSRDIVAEAVFVPEHRVMPTRELFRGDFEGHAGPLYRLPVMGALASMLAGNVVGIAQRGLDGFVGATRVREEVYTGTAKAQKASIQMRIAESLGEVELAQSLVDKNCELLDAAMHARRPPPIDRETIAALRWNAAYAAELCRRSTERVYAAAGAGATHNRNALQRWFRDINTACHHAIVDFDGMLEARGRMALGLSPGAPL